MKHITLFLLVGSLCTSVIAQSTFANLGFERFRYVPLGNPNIVATSNAIPGWSAEAAGQVLPFVLFNGVSYGAPALSVHSGGSIEGIPVLDGDYSLYLQTSSPDGLIRPSVFQTGWVPSWAKSMQFLTDRESLSLLEVSVNGTNLPTWPLHERIHDGYLWAVDVSGFADQVVELRFTAAGFALLDRVEFGMTVVPEPSINRLLVSAAAALWIRRRSLAHRLREASGAYRAPTDR